MSTEDEDIADRHARLQGYLNLGLSIAGLAALFVPVLGQALLGLTAVQLADEVYEGYQDWQLGDRNAALGHLFNVAETVALGAVTAAGTAALGKLAQRVARVDAMVPVSLEDGQLRLCDPALSAYQHDGVNLIVGQAATENGRTLRRLHDATYEVSEHSDGTLRIHHPTRPGPMYQLLNTMVPEDGCMSLSSRSAGRTPLTWCAALPAARPKCPTRRRLLRYRSPVSMQIACAVCYWKMRHPGTLARRP